MSLMTQAGQAISATPSGSGFSSGFRSGEWKKRLKQIEHADLLPDLGVPEKDRIYVNDWPLPKAVIPLWPNVTAAGLVNPNLIEEVSESSKDPKIHSRRAKGISKPRLAFFPAPKPNGAAMLIIPGGGYGYVVFDHEGYEIAQWLNDNGISAYVLLYRLPAEGWASGPDTPLIDAQRAMRVIRSRATKDRIDPERVGVMGFSAGGHLTASLATRFDAKVYEPVDQADSLSARPFLAAPIYPVLSMEMAVVHKGSRQNLLGLNPTDAQLVTYSPNKMITAQTPPVFLAHAEDDGAVPVENSLMFRQALKAQNITVETHLFPTGGHGFGLRKVKGTPTAAWGELFLNFAKARGLFNGT